MSYDWEQIRKDIESRDPSIHFEAYWDPNYGEVILSRDKNRAAVRQWIVSMASFNSKTIVDHIIYFWDNARRRHPESYLVCKCHAHVNPVARSWHITSTAPVNKSQICLCGIDRRDCDYHK